MKINMGEEARKNSAVSQAVLYATRGDLQKFFPDLGATPAPSVLGAEVKLLINGEETNFVEYLDRLKETYDEVVARKALELLKERLAPTLNLVNDLEKRIVEDAHEKLGLDLRIED